MKSRKIQIMMEIAICAALAMVLDSIILFKGPQGGSVSLAMLPVLLVAFRRGTKAGLITGLLFAMLQMIFNPYFVHPAQIFLDYIFAFTSIGLAGIMMNPIKNSFVHQHKVKAMCYVALGTFLGSLMRFLAHFLAGIIFYGSYAPEGTPVLIYSLVYNAGYMIPSFLLCAATLIILISAAPVLINIKKYRNRYSLQ